MDAFQAKWVKPFYLNILHANYMGLSPQGEQELFNDRVTETLAEIDEGVVTRLLSGYWREQITGSWFCGLKQWRQFGDTIGNLIVPSRTCYAGQGYCFALACFADDTSVAHLTKYLDTYLPQVQLHYDQDWAMPALMWIDEQKGTSHSKRYLTPGGLWEMFVVNKNDAWTIETCKRRFWRAMDYCRQHYMATS